jgi:hypothetical protein
LLNSEVDFLKISYFISLFISLFITGSLKENSLSYEDNNGLLNISNNESKSKDLDVFANIIFWTARESGADCWAEEITTTSISSINDLQQVKFNFDPGFRLGISYQTKHDKLNLKTYYTWFYTKGKDSLSNNIENIHSTYLGGFYLDNSFGIGLSGPTYKKANISWAIHYNVIDLEVNKKFLMDKSLSFDPLLGIKIAFIDQFIKTKWEDPIFFGFKNFNVGIENIKNNFWGVGPKIGINSKLDILKNKNLLYLFSDFSFAFMFSHFSFSDNSQTDANQKVVVNLQDINSASSMIEMFMGFGSNKKLKNGNQFSLKLGYASQFWLDQLQFYSFTAGRLVNLLSLQGANFEVNFNF